MTRGTCQYMLSLQLLFAKSGFIDLYCIYSYSLLEESYLIYSRFPKKKPFDKMVFIALFCTFSSSTLSFL